MDSAKHVLHVSTVVERVRDNYFDISSFSVNTTSAFGIQTYHSKFILTEVNPLIKWPILNHPKKP